jgi:hypothetical protein
VGDGLRQVDRVNECTGLKLSIEDASAKALGHLIIAKRFFSCTC